MPDHPKNIGKYQVTRPLGKGAMGMVYEGFDPVIERKVAIKTIMPEFLDASELQEAVATFALVNAESVPMKIQYDYCAAYLEMFTEAPVKAR